MIFRQINNGSLALWLWYAIIALASSMRCDSVMRMANKDMDLWHNKKGGIAGFLLYAIIVIVLIIVLIVVLRFLLGVI